MPDEPAPPVSIRRRVDGWTPERRRDFLATLAETRSVTRAALASGLSKTAAYKLRNHPGAGDFAAAWEEAVRWRRP
ncbi:MAG: hypothetical protein J7494_11505 [Sphingobium sp.]|nr:hypothetical protein [Sphingobium sp.]